MALLRTDKLLSTLLCITRSEAGKLLRSGRVTIDGRKPLSGAQKIDTSRQCVALDGQPLEFSDKVYILMNKPQGVVCATHDSSETVLDILPPELRRADLFPVGRLDKDTTGLLIITNDGDFSHRVTAPNNRIVKRYRVTLEDTLTNEQQSALEAGVLLKDGTKCLPAQIIREENEKNTIIIGICQGKYHQVKRMIASVGNKVLVLHRISIGGLALDENITISQCILLKNGEEQKIFTN